MSRLNTRTASAPIKTSPVIATTNETSPTYEGGLGYERTPRAELLLAAVTSLNEDTFYESRDARVSRFQKLANDDSVKGNPEWAIELISWLRKYIGLRSIPMIVAMTIVKARLESGLFGFNRAIVTASIGRLDETGDFLAGWMSLYGRSVPSCVRRGIADALRTLLNERSYLKWRGRMASGDFALRDVINFVHPTPVDWKQEQLISFILDESYGKYRPNATRNLPVIHARREFMSLHSSKKLDVLTGPDALRTIKEAALTHEVIATGLHGVIPGEVWEVLVPSMGYTALRMNLRRIAASPRVTPKLVEMIKERIGNYEGARASRTLPVAFYAAYKTAPLEFATALQEAANASLENVPALKGRTLLLLDRSFSMSDSLSKRSALSRQDAANVFAAALAIRGENVRVVAFDTSAFTVQVKATDLLRAVEEMPRPDGGTYTPDAVYYAYQNGETYDRIIILTDEMYSNGAYNNRLDRILDKYAPNIPVFTWNLAGYKTAHVQATAKRWTFGGLTDAGFNLITLLEEGFSQKWPWD